jgi:hypothetical protein
MKIFLWFTTGDKDFEIILFPFSTVPQSMLHLSYHIQLMRIALKLAIKGALTNDKNHSGKIQQIFSMRSQ